MMKTGQDVEKSPSPKINKVHWSKLEEVEKEGRPPFILTMSEIKLLGITGVGFFLDAYDLFIINPVSTMLQYRLYSGKSLPTDLEGFVKAAATIGNVIGQFAFGYAADALGRKAVYGKELMLIILGTILTMTTPTGTFSPRGALVYLGIFRILVGIGVGGDYPLAATVMTDRANIRKRGTMLSYIVTNQGWGSLVGGLMAVIVLACYKHVMEEGKVSKVDGAWRIIVGVSLIPAFGTLYQRLTLPESTRYEKAKLIQNPEFGDVTTAARLQQNPQSDHSTGSLRKGDHEFESELAKNDDGPMKTKAHFKEILAYFREWRHLRLIIGTASCWFLVDIAFYGINLNQNVVLQQIGFDGSSGTPWERLFKIATGNIIITSLGLVPGYWVTVLTIEKLGRKFIQIQGFLMTSLFLAILAAKFHSLSKPAFIVLFALLQFFFNFGPNSTVYCFPAEVFPTRYRASAHGFSAACGKAGAIVSALAFNTLSKKVGTPIVLWIFFGCNIAGAFCTLLLPEVCGRDPDTILAKEIEESNVKRLSQSRNQATQ